MGLSHVIRMPDLAKLEIPAKQRLISVKDEQIFRGLRSQNRQIADQEGGAAKGDFVLFDATDSRGGSRTLHIELGGKYFPDYEGALLGCKAGQELHAQVDGDDTLIHVRSVRKVIEFPLTDVSIAALHIPGAATLAEYREKYLREHGDEIAERVFRAIQQKLKDRVLDMTEFSLDDSEMDLYHQRQCTMLRNIFGDIDERLRKAYGADGAKTLEKCYQQFYADNKRSFLLYLLGKAMAEQDHATPTETEYRQALESYCLIFEKTEEQVEQEGLQEEALRSFYIQYGIGRIRDYFKSVVRFSAVGISSQPLEG